MSTNPIDLADDFPGQEERIHALKTSNNRFGKLYDEYVDLSRAIHRIESRVEPADEDREEELKRRRVHLKDELAAMLMNAES